MNQMAPSSNSELDRAIATISRAKGSKEKWLEVAYSVVNVRDKELWRGRYKSATEWLDAAAHAYGVTTNTLRRLLAAAKFFREQVERRKKPDTPPKVLDFFAGNGAHMGTIELIKRMHDVSPGHANKAFEDHIAGMLSNRDAKQRYDALFRGREGRVDFIIGNPPYAAKAFDPAKVSRRRAHKERNELGALIESHIQALSGIDSKDATIAKVRLEYVTPDAVVVGYKETYDAFVDGYDFKRLALGTTRTALCKLLSDAAFSATFFRRYWLILEATETDANDVVASVEDLELANVGVARYQPAKQDDLNLLRTPNGEPVPNRQELSLIDAQAALS